MDRRNFIRTTGITLASALISDNIFGTSKGQNNHLINFPDKVSGIVNNLLVQFSGSNGGELWNYKDLTVSLKDQGTGISIEIDAPKVSLSSIILEWKTPVHKNSTLLNDHWERTYGDVSWHKPKDFEILPWYFLEYNGSTTSGFGIKTGAKAFCSWVIDSGCLRLSLDLRSGGDGVQLGNRTLKAAEIVTIKCNLGESAFLTARRFAGLMCASARMPKEPVYGINDWYFTYGNNSEKLIMEHTRMMAPLADGLKNRPFSVIDAGWFAASPSSPDDTSCWGDNMDTSNAKFPDMGKLAEKIRETEMRPGIWTRPLCGSYKDSKSILLPLIKGREANKPVLDPSIPENLERVKGYFNRYREWSYEMVKFDFTSYDIFGKWGFEMLKDGTMSESNWRMSDNSRTNTEIVLNLYQIIREAAGEVYIIGCNTFSHLSAGLFELNRIGDDTSGNEWERTRKMGVNTLAFRGAQHGTFYAADCDCVGLTVKVPWTKNRQWMELVAKSGMPLFISAQPEAIGPEQKRVIKQCFKLASSDLPVAEPLDWMETAFPSKWKLNNKMEHFNWD